MSPRFEADDVNDDVKFGIDAAYRTECRHQPPILISCMVGLGAVIKFWHNREGIIKLL